MLLKMLYKQLQIDKCQMNATETIAVTKCLKAFSQAYHKFIQL